MAERRPLVMGPAGVQELPIGDTLPMSGPTVFYSGMTCEQGKDYISPTNWFTYRRTAATGIEFVDPAIEPDPFNFVSLDYERVTSLGSAVGATKSWTSGQTNTSGAQAVAEQTNTPAIAANTRTPVISVTGAGEFCFFSMRVALSAGGATYRLEIELDGRIVHNVFYPNSATGSQYAPVIGQLIAIGTDGNFAPVFDPLVFKTNARVWVTPTTAMSAGVRNFYTAFKASK